MLQVGEKTRFVDELEYLLEELQVRGSPNFSIICASLDDLIGKSCHAANSHSNSFFGLQLKSHGVLLEIFESLSPGGALVGDGGVHLRLLVLVGYLLHDVRRLDFFVPANCALKLAHFCFLESSEKSVCSKDSNWSLLKNSPIFTASAAALKQQDHLAFLGIWILTKMTLASLNSAAEDRFCDVLGRDEWLCASLFACLFAPFEEIVRDRAAALLDALFTVAADELVAPEDLISRLLSEASERKSVSAFKLAVSLTGSAEGASFLSRSPSPSWMPSLELLLQPFEDEALQPLAQSCFVNLIDRVPETVLDDLRTKDCSAKRSLLEELASQFEAGPSLLLALAIALAAHQNKTNAAVIKAAWREANEAFLCEKLRSFVDSFLVVQRDRKQRRGVRDSEQEERILLRLQSSISMY